jgi:hypothetical protein
MKDKWASTDRILSSHVFFLHAFILKFLAIGFLAQHAKTFRATGLWDYMAEDESCQIVVAPQDTITDN